MRTTPDMPCIFESLKKMQQYFIANDSNGSAYKSLISYDVIDGWRLVFDDSFQSSNHVGRGFDSNVKIDVLCFSRTFKLSDIFEYSETIEIERGKEIRQAFPGSITMWEKPSPGNTVKYRVEQRPQDKRVSDEPLTTFEQRYGCPKIDFINDLEINKIYLGYALGESFTINRLYPMDLSEVN